ncbi:MAG: rhodanese-like domain-containing protein [Chloroflexi bacterium]|nr:rhodanese-like domain-containing protein [Chloroflexota bacterium]
MPTSITRDELQELIRAGAQIVDVLPPGEFAEYHLPGALSIPLKDLDASSTERLSKDKPVVVY